MHVASRKQKRKRPREIRPATTAVVLIVVLAVTIWLGWYFALRPKPKPPLSELLELIESQPPPDQLKPGMPQVAPE